MSDDNKSFTFQVDCPCGAKFYFSFASGDAYISDSRKFAGEKYDIFIEQHKKCTEATFRTMKDLLIEAKEEIVKLRKEANELPNDWKL